MLFGRLHTRSYRFPIDSTVHDLGRSRWSGRTLRGLAIAMSTVTGVVAALLLLVFDESDCRGWPDEVQRCTEQLRTWRPRAGALALCSLAPASIRAFGPRRAGPDYAMAAGFTASLLGHGALLILGGNHGDWSIWVGATLVLAGLSIADALTRGRLDGSGAAAAFGPGGGDRTPRAHR